ncbi:uncharacterized protein ACMZJ9_010137 [Mantella aurantiaca]
MERKRLRKELEKLLGDYVSTTLREKEFDPKGRRESSSLDDLAHYDLAIGVALQWLSSSSCNEALKKERIKLALNQHKYPNRMEREAMILSSFAGTLMHSLPVDDVFEIYGSKPSAMHLHSSAKGHCVQPFNLSLHPFAMLTAPQAARHALKHCARFCKYLGRNENGENENHNSKVIATHHHEPDSEREEEASAVSETEEDTAAKTEKLPMTIKYACVVVASFKVNGTLVLHTSRGIQIIFYEDRNFQGRSHECSSDSSDLLSFFNRCGSIRVEHGNWMVYEFPNYRGCQFFLKRGEYPDFEQCLGFGDSIRSCRIIPQQTSCKIRVYEREDFKGQMMEFTEDCPQVYEKFHYHDIYSCNVLEGHWIFYEEPNYRGRQYYLRPGEYRRYSDWGGVTSRVGSFRRAVDFH